MADYETLLKRAEMMRKNPTQSERNFKRRLKSASIPFQSQVILEPYIVDFLIGVLIVEIDGSVHHSDEAKRYDQRRDAILKSRGFKILRIPNEKVKTVDLDRFRPSGIKKAKQKAQKKAERLVRRAERKHLEHARQKLVEERNSRPRLIKKAIGASE